MATIVGRQCLGCAWARTLCLPYRTPIPTYDEALASQNRVNFLNNPSVPGGNLVVQNDFNGVLLPSGLAQCIGGVYATVCP